ncbi:hypothetical protein VEE30_11440 [Escherichia coli]|nr:hypothetical protein VEE30_11440 [Escherichia coli]
MYNIHPLLSWSTTPKYQQLEFCIQLCWDYLLRDSERNNQMSARRLTKVTFDYGLSQNIIKLVKSMHDYKLAQAKKIES